MLIHAPKFPELSLAAVSASSADNAWAVGSYFDSADRTLALHWNGHSWKQIITPQASQPANFLQGVAVVPNSGDAWAVGSADPAASDGRPLIFQWDGTAWH